MSQTVNPLLQGEWRIDKISINGKMVFDSRDPELFIAAYYEKQVKNIGDEAADSTALRTKAQVAQEAMAHSYFVFAADKGVKAGSFHEDDKGAHLMIFPGSYETDGQRMRITLFKKSASNEEYLFTVNHDILLLKVKGNESSYFQYRKVIIK